MHGNIHKIDLKRLNKRRLQPKRKRINEVDVEKNQNGCKTKLENKK